MILLRYKRARPEGFEPPTSGFEVLFLFRQIAHFYGEYMRKTAKYREKPRKRFGQNFGHSVYRVGPLSVQKVGFQFGQVLDTRFEAPFLDYGTLRTYYETGSILV